MYRHTPSTDLFTYMRGIQKETSQRSRNRNQYMYVTSIGPGCCTTVAQGETVPHVLLDVVFRGESFAPQSILYATKNGIIGGREVWTVWRVSENLPLEFLQECREFLLAFSHVTCIRDPLAVVSELPRSCRNHSLLKTQRYCVTSLHIPDSSSFLFEGLWPQPPL